VQELKVKLDSLPQVSHTTVIKRKEEHLASKVLKSDLHRLANRRFGRAQEVSTENVLAIIRLWAKRKYILKIFIIQSCRYFFMAFSFYFDSPRQLDEESVAIEEVKALGEVVQEIELSVERKDVHAALNQAFR
jgi:hypothetical protein